MTELTVIWVLVVYVFTSSYKDSSYEHTTGMHHIHSKVAKSFHRVDIPALHTTFILRISVYHKDTFWTGGIYIPYTQQIFL